MHSFDFGTVELRMLWASAVLGIIQLLLAVLFSVGVRGMPWALGARDDAGAPLNTMGGRVERAYRNFLETFPLFAVAVLLGNALNKHTPQTALGAELYFYGRVVFLPVYALGIPVLRTLVWVVALAGIAMSLRAIWPG